MTCGIYKLSFSGTDKVYIGQSINIENRYLSHLRSLIKNKSPRKLQEAYDLYGLPELETILECDENELNSNENEAISIYDSFTNGFNSLETAEEMPKWKNQLRGEDGPSAVYTNEEILNVFKILAELPTLSLPEISEITGVNTATIRKIHSGVQHTWVHDKYPSMWQKVVEMKNTRNESRVATRALNNQKLFNAKAQGIVYPIVVSPEGVHYVIDNLSEFCRIHGLERSNLRNVFKGTRNMHKGWTVLK